MERQTQKYTLPHGQPHWNALQEQLKVLQAFSQQHEKTLLPILQEIYSITHPSSRLRKIEGLEKAFSEISEELNFKSDEFIEILATEALHIENLFPEPKLTCFSSGQGGSIVHTRNQIRCLNIHAFFGTLHFQIWNENKNVLHMNESHEEGEEEFFCHENEDEEEKEIFDFCWIRMLIHPDHVEVNRIKCQISYFYQTFFSEFYPNELITYTKKINYAPIDWKSQTNIFGEVELSPNRIENQSASCHLDFANKKLHIGRIARSATQEEICFSIRPECFPALLFFQTMNDMEVIILSNVQRYSNYSGYMNSFRYQGMYESRLEEQSVHILAMDAIINYDNCQFEKINLIRDLNKIQNGFSFSNYENEWISTGSWGCGVFDGNLTLKFLQQIMGAAILEKKLYFSCSKQNIREELQNLANELRNQNLMVKDIWDIISNYDPESELTFEEYVWNKIFKE